MHLTAEAATRRSELFVFELQQSRQSDISIFK
jgi:hypothetical protein